MNRRSFPLVAVWLAFSGLGACSNGGSALSISELYSESVEELNVEVDYMVGAEPYTADAADGQPVWNFFKNNLAALFHEEKTVTVPTTLAEMERIPAGDTNYSADDILALAEIYRDQPPIQGRLASVYYIFLDGFYVDDEGEVSSATLGVTLGDTGVIALFKPAITSNTFPSTRLRTFTEQSVLIHEGGHALGLVGRGVPVQSDHLDPDHGAHCTNTSCVMYYLNEGAKDLLEFIARDGDPSTEKVIFGFECLQDTAEALK